MSRIRVKSKGVLYDRVSAIIYRTDGDKIKVTAELKDLNGHSVTIADPKFITEDKSGD